MSEAPEPSKGSAERWLNLTAVFVAPTSLITGLCYFFARLSIGNRLHYFGTDPTALGYTSADYVATTISVFFFATLIALFVCAVLVLLAVGVGRWAQSGRRSTSLRVLAWVLLALGALAVGAAMVWLVSEYSLIDKAADHLIGKHEARYTAWSVLVGIALLAAGYWMLASSGGIRRGYRLPRGTERALLAVTAAGMVVALFWITDLYAVQVGKDRATYDARYLWPSDGPFTAVQLDTTEALNLPPDLVKTSVLPTAGPPAPTPTYRYECLRVLEAHGGRYVLVPAKWQHNRGHAITVTPDASHRITGLVRAANTGQDVNVYPFWQCPEVVPVFQESDLDRLLIGPDAAQILSSAQGLTPAIAPPPSEPHVPAKGCASQDSSTTSATRQVKFTGTSSAGPVSISQRVSILPDAAGAAQFKNSTKDDWHRCAGQSVTVNRETPAEQRTLGPWTDVKDILVAADSAVGSTANDCAQALAIKSNVVIAVDVCGGPQSPSSAAGIAAAVRDRIPT